MPWSLPAPTLRHRLLFLIFSFVAGAFILSSFATFQTQMVLHIPLRLRNYLVPVMVGGSFGLAIGFAYQKLHLFAHHLHARQITLRTILDSLNIGIAVIDAATLRFTDLNNTAATMIGAEKGSLIGAPCHDHLCPTSTGGCPLADPLLTVDNAERLLIDATGRRIPILKTVASVMLDGKRHFLESFIDIHDRKESEEKLRRSHEFLRLVLNSMNDAVSIINIPDRRIVAANSVFLREVGLPEQEVIGRPCSEIIFCTSGGCDSSDSCPLNLTETDGEHRQVQHIHNHGGREVYLEITTSPITDDNGVVRQVVHVARDITERKLAEQEIQQLAYYDTLTSLPNRTLLKDRLGQALAQASRSSDQIGVMFLDLDRFKGVNDTLGHAVGDQLLKTVSSRLSATLRRSDTVARLGGDEFVIVVSSVPHAEYLADVAAKILAIVAQPARIANHDLFLTGSIGMALFPSDGDTVDTLLKHADIAMYQAKEKGRNTYQFFSHEMNTKALERMALETSLRQALERNEFFLLYQPQYALGNGQIVGVEALLRWQHPELGVVRPGQFIPLAEETGLILPIGEWVLRQATHDGCRWLQQNLPFQRIAVNISPHQCRQQDPGYLGRLLKEVGFPPTSLELELTETSIMENPREIASKLRLFQEMGVALAIDDFGTGYSSLNYLKHFPLDRLKIAQTFVRDSGKSQGDAAIAEAIIGLAHALRLRVIAEGVETMEQLTFLRERGCNEVQGYLTGRPMPAEELEQLLASDRNEVGQMLTSY